MSKDVNELGPFAVKDCALLAIATGKKATNLSEMLNLLPTVHAGSIYHHFLGALLRPRFDEPEYNNDFASWAYYGLRDIKLAERLAVIDPIDFPNLEALRQHLIEIIEQRVDEIERLSWVPSYRAFHFQRAEIVVFDTRNRVEHPEEFAELIPYVTLGTVFYHFIDARRRSPEGIDDFRAWLSGFGDRYVSLSDQLALLDPYFTTLAHLRDKLAEIFSYYFRTVSS